MAKEKFKVLYVLNFAWQLGFTVLIDIGIFAFLGFCLDKILKTKPIFLVLGIVLGPIIAAFQIYSGLTPLLKKDNKSKK